MGRNPSSNYIDLTDKDPVAKGLAMRIRKLRLDHHLTQREFGNLIDLTTSDIKRLEYARGFPTLHMLITIKKRFNLTYDYLIEGKK